MKIFFYILTLASFCACMSPNGRPMGDIDDGGCPENVYCALLSFTNGQTGDRKEDQVSVVVAKDHIIAILFKDGGSIDEHHFGEASVQNNKSSFSAKNGDRYKIVLKKRSCDYTPAAAFEQDLSYRK